MNEKLEKTKKYLGKIASMTRNNWGPKPRLMRWAYLGVVRPMLCYGAMIWGHRAPELMGKLRRINRMAMCTFASFPKSTPTSALEIMLDILPLHLFCVQEAVAARLRLDSVLEFGWHGKAHTKRHATSHMEFLRKKLEEYGITPGDQDRCSVLKWGAKYKINRDSFDGQAKHRQPTQMNVYTDGSRLDGKTGAGLTVHRGTREVESKWFRLPEHATVFQAEITAVAKAARCLIDMGDKSIKFVKIFVDSQAAIMAMGNPIITSRAVLGAIEELNKLAEQVRSVSIVWIPAHKGHEGNERADELAKRGSGETDPEKKVMIGRPVAEMRSNLRNRVYEEWGREWKESRMANHTKSFYGAPNPGKAKYVYKLARLELGRFIRIITGHNNLNFFQNKIGLSLVASCRFCGEDEETITHLLRVCPRHEQGKKELFLDKLPTSDMAWSVRDLLNFSYIPGINGAFEGVWNEGERPTGGTSCLDDTVGIDWLEGDGVDDNNNGTVTGVV